MKEVKKKSVYIFWEEGYNDVISLFLLAEVKLLIIMKFIFLEIKVQTYFFE